MVDGLIFKCSQYRDPSVFNLGFDFLDNDFNSPYGYRKFEGHIEIKGSILEEKNEYYAEETIVDIGEIRFHAYNLDKLGFDFFHQDWETAMVDSSLYEAMDVDSSDTVLYFSVFEKGFDTAARLVSHTDWVDMAMAVNEGYLITLDRCYINPEYRKMGIGQFIHENLFKILYTEFNIVPLFVVGICVPDEGEPENMLDIQKKVLIENGFEIFEHNGETSFCNYIYDNDFMVDISQ